MAEGSGSRRSVMVALCGNTFVLIAKVCAFALTGSSAMLAEVVHSFGDVTGQGLLFLGIERGKKKADHHFAFGYGKERFFWSAMAAVLFAVLGAVTIREGISAFLSGHEPHFTIIAFALFSVAIVVETLSLVVALRAIGRSKKDTSWGAYFRDNTDPSGIAVLIEDIIAVVSILIASVGILLAAYTKNYFYDALASVLIGFLMIAAAIFLINLNRMFLTGRTHEDTWQDVMEVLRRHAAVERVHDLRAIIQGVGVVVVHAEVEFKEEAILGEVKNPSGNDREFGTAIIQHMSAVIDDVEAKIRKACPEVTRIDIEVEQYKAPVAADAEGATAQNT